MKITTWNINSVRLRLPLLERLIDETAPDVICLQETKCVDDCFPLTALAAKGYAHRHVHGMKSYNGVAILSKQPLTNAAVHHWAGREDRRHISARHASGIEIHNLYVPAGGDVPDPAVNEKFRHKLDFVAALTNWSERLTPGTPRVLVGDLNIAPLEHDVWSSKTLKDTVSHTPVERQMMAAWQATGGWVDAGRHFTPTDQKLYSWWSYRSPNWQTRDLGRRLDHIWVSPDLRDDLRGITHARHARAWDRPSDHVPVTLDVNT